MWRLDCQTTEKTVVDQDNTKVKIGTLKPGDEVPDGDKAKPATDMTIYGGAVVGNSANDDVKK